MSFGFSVGDFVAVGGLILDITKSLQDVGGAKSDYQELLQELKTLQIALEHLDSLERVSPHSPYLESIKFAALSCRQPLEQFLHKIKKYEQSLGTKHKVCTARTAASKLQWAFGKREEVQKLQNYLNLHATTINMLLMEHGLATVAIANEDAKSDNLHIRKRLDQTRGILDHVKENVQEQQLLVKNTQSLISRLLEMISGEFRTSWRSFGDMVARVS